MSSNERPPEAPGAGLMAVVAVLAPVLSGALAAVLLLAGYLLKLFDPQAAITQILFTGGWVFGALTAAAILLAAAGLLLTALRNSERTATQDPHAAPTRTDAPSRTGLRTMDFASFVAGGRRAHLREEWAAVLAGDPGHGIVLTPRRRRRYATGFLWAALRMRLGDMVAPLWVPVDWLLSGESRTHGFIALAVGAQLLYIQHEDGLHVLVTEGWGWCAGCGIALRLFAGWLRRVRGIELAATRGEPRER
ncbi:hypothetical protein [Streptomyces sp. NPDC055099]